MYSVSRQDHPTYANIVLIIREDNGMYATPGLAYNYAMMCRRRWRDEGAKKVRFLIDDQIMNPAQAEVWAKTEYQSLPKCFNCGAILHGNVFTHPQCESKLFCKQTCADQDYQIYMDNLLDEEEIELD
jgi:hypothetical protein